MLGNSYQFFLNLPFGETMIEGCTNTSYELNYKFNAKELDAESGMYYYGARYYDPRISVWLSVDPMAEKRSWLSPYNYCQNNPIIRIDKDGKVDGDIYNLNGVHIGNDGINDNKVYLNRTTDNKQLTKEQSLTLTNNSQTHPSVSNTIDVTAATGLTNDELNLRSFLSTLKQAEAGSSNPPLDYNSWNNGKVFTSEKYTENPQAYSSHPGTNSPYGSAAGAYQFLKRFYVEKDFSPISQDRAAVSNMTSNSYNAALSGNVSLFIDETKGRWTSLQHWSNKNLESVFNGYRANELQGNSNIASPIGSLLKN